VKQPLPTNQQVADHSGVHPAAVKRWARKGLVKKQTTTPTGRHPNSELGGIPPLPEMLSPAQVAALFGVDPRTVTRWAHQGRLTAIRTPGGHHRFPTSEIRRLLTQCRDQQETEK
jgi:excisionase family DNA binding protein